MSEIKKIVHPAGEVIDFETVFFENSAILGEPTQVGKFERIDYTTDVYEDGITYPKYCNVYLPWCYDPADKTRKYNVMYYQHGNTCDPDLFTIPENKKRLDCLFETGEIAPCILVFTTYYFDVTKDVDIRKKTGSVPAGDGNWEGIKANFYREVVEDILPAVESRYNVYAEDVTPEGLKAARDHRGFSGYSRGSVCTWYILHNDFEYFRWYAPMSCHTVCGKGIRAQLTPEEVVDYVTAPIKAHPELPFFIFATNGYPKDVAQMTEQMKYLPKAPEFSYGKDPTKNNFYFALSDFTHTDILAPFYYYNSLQTLFIQ